MLTLKMIFLEIFILWQEVREETPLIVYLL
jgi:hypothetical protein